MKGKPGKTVPTGFGNDAAIVCIDYEKCTKCGMCVTVCSSETIIDIDGTPTVVPDNGLGCIGCGQCMAACAFDAVAVNGRRLCPADILKMPAKEDMATPQTLDNLMLSRRSIRHFSKRPLEKELIDRMLEMAANAPMGIPPSDVEVIVVNGFDKVQELAGDLSVVFAKWKKFLNPVVLTFMRPFSSKGEIEALRDFIVPICGEMVEARHKGIDMLFYDAPCVLLFHNFPGADPMDGSIACTYAMLAAQSLGLGTTMIGTVAFALQREKKLKKKWGIPAENKVSIAMIVGHPSVKYQNVIRRTFASVKTA